jgi:hypothetical protein
MVRVIRVADDGTEVAAIEVDDFTIEVVYSGIALMLREAAGSPSASAAYAPSLASEARRRREKVLTRLRG